ncbi:MAG TPA: molecular chaperone DjiA [Rhodospirillales bacterium]|nr:molecular chaperone DjiA [Rhodospirillales bacterium]
MSIWGKVIGGVAGFALGGPLGAILGSAFGHAIDRSKSQRRLKQGPVSIQTRQTAFTVGVIVLSAKMAKADGMVTRDEVNTFKKVFNIPPDEMHEVGLLFDQARRDAEGYEPYAGQIGELFAHDPVVLENLLGGLFQIALSDGFVHPKELAYLNNVSRELGLDRATFERIRAAYMVGEQINPYEVLGVTQKATSEEVKKAYRNLTRENHPDTLIAQGMPQEFVEVANEKMAKINTAYASIQKQRSLS